MALYLVRINTTRTDLHWVEGDTEREAADRAWEDGALSVELDNESYFDYTAQRILEAGEYDPDDYRDASPAAGSAEGRR